MMTQDILPKSMTPSFIKSPLIQSIPISDKTNKKIHLKLEFLQPSGSFKDRGIGHLCEHLAQQNCSGFVSSSGGNAGMAVAYAARRLGLAATVIVPKTTSPLSIEKIKQAGAQVIIYGSNWNEADELAKEKSAQLNLGYIPPFDNPLIWEGYEAIIDEFKEANYKPDAIVLSVGGGGLFTGIVQGLNKHQWLNDVMILTAETKGAATLATSVAQNKHIRLDKIDTIAGTLGAKQIAKVAFDWTQKITIKPQVVSDAQAIKACLNFAYDHRILVEPACGAALSVVYEPLPDIQDYQSICVIVCGGNAVSPAMLEQWKQQFNL